ncbi:MAG: hypothetical protein MR654_10050 [Corynebacterium glucuronolyticum]|nr:hypothetical protein [Corynebacterium glucuronolyticum]
MPDNTPTIDEFRPVILRVLAAGGQVMPFREIHERVADEMSLDANVRAEVVSSGQARYINRISWACSRLWHAGLIERPKRGHYRITDNGKAVNSRNLTAYAEKDMLEWPVWRAYQSEVWERKQDTSSQTDGETSTSEPAHNDETKSPSEIMAHTEQLYNLQVETELRSRLQQVSPEFFEKAVLELLWAMGYGGKKGRKVHVG